LAAAAPARAQDGRAALARYGCANCHQLPGRPTLGRGSCGGCHREVLGRRRSGLGRAPHVEHYVHAPDLRNIARRLRPAYLVRFLQDPHDVRPRLEETMPRLPVTPEDARAIVAFLRASAGPVDVPRAPAPLEANVTPGRAAFRRAGCPGCHDLGNLDFGVHLPPAAFRGLRQQAYEAPNLRFVRDRLEPDVALAWIRDPRTIDPNTQMPHPSLTRQDAVAIRDFLFLTDLGDPVRPPPAPRFGAIRALPREVRFAEVRRIFNRSCIHCHAHTTGSASASALGFEATALDLSTAAGVRRGTVLPDGSTRSVLAPDASGVPPLVGRLLRRHEEAARDLRLPREDTLEPVVRPAPSANVGMPLGLPPVPMRDLRVLVTWIQQGAR
ncbi:MAG: hypothetical protein ACFCGT_21035, partial [Sandaracinaceae bacterium]